MASFKYIIIPVIVVITTQFIKVIIDAIKYKKLDIVKFFDGMGGMPSSHSALVASISTLLFLDCGVCSPLFGLCLIFSLVVVYDSMGIRYESGMQAKVLNKMAKTHLRESLGHKPLEALVGIILGIILSLILNRII